MTSYTKNGEIVLNFQKGRVALYMLVGTISAAVGLECDGGEEIHLLWLKVANFW